jgi:DNA replication licensing factor MCM2
MSDVNNNDDPFGEDDDNNNNNNNNNGMVEEEEEEDYEGDLISEDDDSRGEPFDDEEENEEDEEDLMENMERDYEHMPHLDSYEEHGIHDAEDEEFDPEAELEARFRAEEEMQERDLDGFGNQRGGQTGRAIPRALDDGDDQDQQWRRARRRRAADLAAGDEEDEELLGDDEEFEVNIDSYDCPLREWITKERTMMEIRKRFSKFLRKFTQKIHQEEVFVYKKRMREMCVANRQSLDVSFVHLSMKDSTIAEWVADAPGLMIPMLDEVLKREVLRLYPAYEDIHPEVFVRIAELPIADHIRDIRQSHLNSLIKITGVVTRRSSVFPQLRNVTYQCVRCKYLLGPIQQNANDPIKPGNCPECQGKGPWTVDVERTVYRNYQKLTLQESPGSVPAGRLPRSKEIIVLNDLIDCARPGDEIDITGVYVNSYDASGIQQRNGFPVFSTHVEANHILRKGDAFATQNLTDDDKHEIRELSKKPKIVQRIIQSIAPSIHGHENIKTGLAMAIFGGQEKLVKGKTKLRGDINVLLLGDPGVAKSQFLKYVEKTASRSVYTTGKGASAVGLTAAVHKDPVTREWTLEGGALVLADRGVCLIDEFDKMNDQDRVSIHEAMEQQSISISKAGIVTSLQARCSVIAAANPIGGRYDSSRTFSDNVELTDPILSRFDVLCVVKDVIDPITDRRLAEFVVKSHVRSHPKNTEESDNEDQQLDEEELAQPLEQEMLKKYISYAKRFVNPRLKEQDTPKIARVYSELRKESVTREGMPVAVRHLESTIRMAEARARMRLSESVSPEDIDHAISVMLDSFIGTQKQSVQKSLRKKFAKYAHFHRDYDSLLMEILGGMHREKLRLNTFGNLKCSVLEHRAREYGVVDLRPFYRSHTFLGANFTHDAEQREIICPL